MEITEDQQPETLERDLAETSLIKEHLDSLLDAMNSVVVIVDEKFVIRKVNEGAKRLLAYAEESLIGKSVSSVLACEGPQEFANVAMAIVTASLSEESLLVTKEGLRIPVLISGAPINLADSDAERYVVTAHDLSEHKALEAQLLQALKLESIGQLAAGIAHEINTPLQYVGDNVAFLKNSFEDLKQLLDGVAQLKDWQSTADTPVETITSIQEAASSADIEYLADEIPLSIKQALDGIERVVTIVKAMKQFSHSGGAEKQNVNLNELIEGTINVSKNEWKYCAEIETEFDESLPIVSCYPGELNQVVLNLIVNAAHAIEDSLPEGETKGSISVVSKHEANFAVLTIRDSGCGMEPDVKNKIFDPFFTTKEVGRGTGQGLSIAHKVITGKHGGSISVESEVGKGSTFTIRIPVR